MSPTGAFANPRRDKVAAGAAESGWSARYIWRVPADENRPSHYPKAALPDKTNPNLRTPQQKNSPVWRRRIKQVNLSALKKEYGGGYDDLGYSQHGRDTELQYSQHRRDTEIAYDGLAARLQYSQHRSDAGEPTPANESGGAYGGLGYSQCRRETGEPTVAWLPGYSAPSTIEMPGSPRDRGAYDGLAARLQYSQHRSDAGEPTPANESGGAFGGLGYSQCRRETGEPTVAWLPGYRPARENLPLRTRVETAGAAMFTSQPCAPQDGGTTTTRTKKKTLFFLLPPGVREVVNGLVKVAGIPEHFSPDLAAVSSGDAAPSIPAMECCLGAGGLPLPAGPGMVSSPAGPYASSPSGLPKPCPAWRLRRHTYPSHAVTPPPGLPPITSRGFPPLANQRRRKGHSCVTVSRSGFGASRSVRSSAGLVRRTCGTVGAWEIEANGARFLTSPAAFRSLVEARVSPQKGAQFTALKPVLQTSHGLAGKTQAGDNTGIAGRHVTSSANKSRSYKYRPKPHIPLLPREREAEEQDETLKGLHNDPAARSGKFVWEGRSVSLFGKAAPLGTEDGFLTYTAPNGGWLNLLSPVELGENLTVIPGMVLGEGDFRLPGSRLPKPVESKVFPLGYVTMATANMSTPVGPTDPGTLVSTRLLLRDAFSKCTIKVLRRTSALLKTPTETAVHLFFKTLDNCINWRFAVRGEPGRVTACWRLTADIGTLLMLQTHDTRPVTDVVSRGDDSSDCHRAI
ncbi:hypothetical protein Bbelb_405360 [Branchiostoma belcheri]|nr:hypothetical protein Bbelb_405360 [Branchiostoma belcheri]